MTATGVVVIVLLLLACLPGLLDLSDRPPYRPRHRDHRRNQ